MFLTVDDFLSHFPNIKISKEDFIKEFRVMYSKSLTLEEIFSLNPLCGGRKKALIQKPESDVRYIRQDDVAEYYYEIIIRNRHKYLKCFYKSYFEFKDPDSLKWEGVDILKHNPKLDYPVISLQKNDASKRIIRNLFYLELLDLTKISNTVKSKVSFWQSLVNMYNHLELEDRFFAPSSVDICLREKKTKKDGITINYNNLFYLFQAYQPKASIFNPYTINWILKNVIDSPKSGGKIFSPVLSWCSYIVAYMHHPGYNHYVGVDVMKSVCDKAEYLGSWYQNKSHKYKNKQVDIINSPSQDLGDSFVRNYRNYFDTIIICPPYYDMEIYHEGEQSTETFPGYESWLDGYFRETIKICYEVLKPGGTFAMIANDYFSLKGEFYPLTEDLNNVVQEFMEEGDTFYLQNRTSPLRVNSKKRTERLFLFHKQ